jgi:hypothetical protein
MKLQRAILTPQASSTALKICHLLRERSLLAKCSGDFGHRGGFGCRNLMAFDNHIWRAGRSYSSNEYGMRAAGNATPKTRVQQG